VALTLEFRRRPSPATSAGGTAATPAVIRL
jgi:hypothetical protein